MDRNAKLIEMVQGILDLIKENKIDAGRAKGAQVFIQLADRPGVSDEQFDMIYQMYLNTKNAALV